MHSSGDPSTHAHTFYHGVLTACGKHTLVLYYPHSGIPAKFSKSLQLQTPNHPDFQGCRLGLTGSRGRKACQVDEPGPLEPDSLLSAASCSGWCLPASASRPSSFLLPAGLEGQLDFIKRAWGGDSVGRVYAGPHAVPPSSHSKHASS